MRLFAALVLALVGFAQAAQAQTTADLLKLPHDNYPGGVIALRDVPYQMMLGYHPLTADIYVPTQGKGPFPAVVYGHGGGWSFGNPRNPGTPEALSALAARGYVVLGINYRFYNEARFPGPVQDAKAAVRWIRSNASLYNVDTAHVAYWGVSAGGYLGTMVGTTCGVAALEPPAPDTPSAASGSAPVSSDPKQSDCVQAVVDWFSPVDFAVMDSQALPGSRKHSVPDSTESGLMGCSLTACAKALLDSAKPMTYSDAKDPPFLIMHGDNDHSVPLPQSQEFYDALKAKGVNARLVVVPGADHIWVGATDAQKRDIRQTTFDFLDSVLKPH